MLKTFPSVGKGSMHQVIAVSIGLGLAMVARPEAPAAIVYANVSAPYSENFDSLPTDTTTNASIESIYVNGWRDDTTTIPGTEVSVPGWYLYHPLMPANENGFNGHQRIRMGSGQNTGGFWGFGISADEPEKALGSIGSTTVAANEANMYIALRLVNQTGRTLDEFTLMYDGEQWRDGEATTPETLSFGYSLTAMEADWFSTAIFSNVPGLSFTSPFFDNTGASGSPVDGNVEGSRPGIAATVTGISWAPGTEMWLRWADPQLGGGLADDGLAIDNVRFVAVPEPAGLSFILLGAISWLGRRRR